MKRKYLQAKSFCGKVLRKHERKIIDALHAHTHAHKHGQRARLAQSLILNSYMNTDCTVNHDLHLDSSQQGHVVGVYPPIAIRGGGVLYTRHYTKSDQNLTLSNSKQDFHKAKSAYKNPAKLTLNNIKQVLHD